MNTVHQTRLGWRERLIFAFLFMLCSTTIYFLFNPWGAGPVLDKVPDYLAKIGTGIVLLALTLFSRKSRRLHQYWQIIFALFILTAALSLDFIFGQYMIKYLGILDITPAGWAYQKLNEALIVICVVIGCTLATGNHLGSIYLQKGKLKLGLLIGVLTFVAAAVGSFPMAALFGAQGLTIQQVIPWIPWVLIFVFANAFMEELLFRGLFLRKLEPFLGKFLSNLMIASVFTLLHGLATYTVDQMIFLAVLFPLALAWGYLMQKTDSLWGSILFHAGMDIPIMLGIFYNL